MSSENDQELDGFDHEILKLLQADGRMPVSAIAEQVSLSATPVSRRIARLEKGGVIDGYGARISPPKVGLNIQALVLANLAAHSDENIRAFEAIVQELDFVVACHAVTGANDYLLHIWARDVEHLNELVLKRLVRTTGVANVTSILVLETIKQIDGIPLPTRQQSSGLKGS